MRKKILLFLLLFTGLVNAQNITIPDANFKAKLLEADISKPIAFDVAGDPIKIDTDNDGEIQLSEALAVHRLKVSNSGIMDLTGISSFINLKNLDCGYNILFNLDVSALVNLVTLNCSGSYFITTLDVSASPNLKQLFCDGNRLTDLNVNGLADLTILSCSNNKLTNLDVNSLTNLEVLICENNKLTDLNINGLNNLDTVMCNSNNLVNLNLSGLPNLRALFCTRNLLTSINVSNLPNLTEFSCFYNQITSLDLSNSINLTSLSCGENKITTLILNGLTKLNNLECSYLPDNLIINGANLNALKSLQYTGSNSTLTLNGFPGLENLNLNLAQPSVILNTTGFSILANIYLAGGPTTSFTVNGSGTTSLKSINCSNSQLNSLNLNGINNLASLNCSNSKLTSLDLSGLPDLTFLDFSRNKITTIDLSNVPNLKHLDCNNSLLGSLNLTGLSNLEYLDCSNHASTGIIGNQITSLDIAGLTKLKYLDCSNYQFNGILGALGNVITSLDVNNLVFLEQLKCSKNRLSSLVVNGLTNLTTLDCSYNLLTSLDLIGLTNITKLNYSYNQLSNLNMIGLVNITELDCSNNTISTLNLSSMPNLSTLNCGKNALTTLDLTGLNQLTKLHCGNNLLTSLDVNTFTNLTSLDCNNNKLTTLDVNNLTNLNYLQCGANNLTTLNLNGLTKLTDLNCSGNELINLDLSTLTSLRNLLCTLNQLTSLDTSSSPNLQYIECRNNQLTNIDFSTLPNLQFIDCRFNQITNLNVSNSPLLTTISCTDNQITTLDVSELKNLSNLYCSSNLLTHLYVKNGRNETNLDFSGNPGLAYICADDAQVGSIQAKLNTLGMTATVSNSYCSFTPGGQHNTLIGTTIFDGNNNGCNVNDPLHPNIRIDISNGSSTGSAFTNLDGTSTFYTQAGSFTITPNIENASAFNILPAIATVDFANNDYNISDRYFCLSANGVHPDVEIVISPITPARPGFDAIYQIVYKNKGNQVLSGNVKLVFDDSRMNLLSATPAVDTQTTNNLEWAYSGLLPFESRVIDLEFNVNTPLVIPAVNNGDILNFTVAITPVAGDESPSDNSFNYNQTVVGSFDPNDITCLQGESVSPDTIGDYLHYIVNFENTGTYEAENIVVKIAVDESKYDISSLQLLNSSHKSQTIIDGNNVEFIFKKIFLPSSEIVPKGGHGNILFKIRTLSDLNIGDEVGKEAGIYFDYNAPIETNEAETVFESLGTKDFNADKSIVLYPNPTKGKVTISSDNTIKLIELFDVQGRILQTAIQNDTTSQFDISGKPNGLYFIRITTDGGKKIEKLIKE